VAGVRAVVLVLLCAIGCLAAPGSAVAISDSGGPVLFGAAVQARGGQTSEQAIAALEGQLGRTFDLHRSYWRWDDAQPTAVEQDDVAHGRIPLISITPQLHDGTKVAWAGIADGSQDAVIGAQADGLRSLGSRVILIFQHEADIARGYGTAADYVAAYRHYVAVFRAHGASNVQFGTAFTPNTYATSIASWYPGDDVVDWIGADAYNFAGCAPGLPAWRSLATAASAFYQWGSARGKPLMLAEWGSAEDPTDPDHKAQWITDAITTLQHWPDIRAVSYFDGQGSCPDWWVDSSPAAYTAFAAMAGYPIAHGQPSARLTVTASIVAAGDAVDFSGEGSTGTHATTGSGIASWQLSFGDGTATRSGLGQPPAELSHTYPAGSWTATLDVTDRYGLSATAHTPVRVAPAPVVAEGTPAQSAGTATLPAWINSSGLPASYHVEWGTSTAYGSVSSEHALPALGWPQAVTYTISGLAGGTRYHWHYVATSAAGTTAGHDMFFTTPAS
jgi:hypothetical protein